MNESAYAQYDPRDLTLRDRLAIDRTVLSNVRTLLSYLRTALALVILGATFLHFLTSAIAHGIGWAFVAVGLLVLVTGAVQFVRTKARLDQIRLLPEDAAPPVDDQ
jgi:putative membrane protein